MFCCSGHTCTLAHAPVPAHLVQPNLPGPQQLRSSASQGWAVDQLLHLLQVPVQMEELQEANWLTAIPLQ
jgi:hypothetical protein